MWATRRFSYYAEKQKKSSRRKIRAIKITHKKDGLAAVFCCAESFRIYAPAALEALR